MSDARTYPELFDRYGDDVEAVLRERVERAPRRLARMMSMHLGWEDDKGQPAERRTPPRLHATLCLRVCEALSGSHTPALPAAAAVELLHAALAVHEDMQEGSPERRGRPTVWWTWGPAQGIATGDALYALARMAVLSLGEAGLPPDRALRVAGMLDEACLRQCEGQIMDAESRLRPEIGVQRYMDLLARKEGALLGCAAGVGAAVASGDTGVAAAFSAYGEKLAVARQLRDDVAAVWNAPGASAEHGGEFWARRKALPVLYALEKASPQEQKQLRTLYGKRALDDGDMAQLRGLLEQAGARAHAEETARRLQEEALEALRRVSLGERATVDLVALARLLGQPGV
ncbi:MAG: polyprenyl synthetase family protein [Dehalococcoidia bacterium]|nr:polyprenyl synthetase family protein [Dehalococcoidia bacterium]